MWRSGLISLPQRSGCGPRLPRLSLPTLPCPAHSPTHPPARAPRFLGQGCTLLQGVARKGSYDCCRHGVLFSALSSSHRLCTNSLKSLQGSGQSFKMLAEWHCGFEPAGEGKADGMCLRCLSVLCTVIVKPCNEAVPACWGPIVPHSCGIGSRPPATAQHGALVRIPFCHMPASLLIRKPRQGLEPPCRFF